MRRFFLHGRVFYGVVLILVIILVILTKIAFSPTNNLPTKTIAPTPTPKTVDLCAPFTADKGKTSCKEAEGIALTRFPGKVMRVEEKSSPVPAEKEPLPNSIPQKPPEPADTNKTTNIIPNPSQRPSEIKFNNEIAWIISVEADHKIQYPDGKSTNIFYVVVSMQEAKILVAYPKF